jgi:UDP-glucose 4-epimerase
LARAGAITGRMGRGVRAMKRVVVTGGSGRLGRYVVAALRNQYDVVNADIRPGESDDAHVAVDVMDIDEVRAVLAGASAVCHLAGLDLDRAANPESYMRVNVLGSWHVMQAAAERGVRHVVLASSVAACGLSEMRSDWRPTYLPVDEEHECRPAHAYGISKLLLERIALSFVHRTGFRATCLRAVHVVADETIAEYLRFIDGPGRRWLFYYVTAEDVARAFSLALATDGPRYGVFFLSAADTSRPEPTLEWYRERVGPLPVTVDDRVYEAMPRASVFSHRAAREALGWEPTSDFLELRSTYETRPTARDTRP